jgi:hypothetical protein
MEGEGDVKKGRKERISVSRERGRATDEVPKCPMVDLCVERSAVVVLVVDCRLYLARLDPFYVYCNRSVFLCRTKRQKEVKNKEGMSKSGNEACIKATRANCDKECARTRGEDTKEREKKGKNTDAQLPPHSSREGREEIERDRGEPTG